MSILTAQTVHARNWMKCPRCDGGSLFTDRDRKQGALCTSCDNKGEVARFPASRTLAGYSSRYEQMVGAR